MKTDSTSSQKMPTKPLPVTTVRQGFLEARQRALKRQGFVTKEQVIANQSTMKSVN
jgi:hypothetical protein